MAITKEFVLAGDATFTVEIPQSAADRPHCTYRVQRVGPNGRWPEAWFAKLLAGPGSGPGCSYLGKLDPFTGQVAATAKSRLPAGSYPFRLLNRVLARIWTGDHAAYEAHGYATRHEGRCGRKLTVPEAGIGPECQRAGPSTMRGAERSGKWDVLDVRTDAICASFATEAQAMHG